MLMGFRNFMNSWYWMKYSLCAFLWLHIFPVFLKWVFSPKKIKNLGEEGTWQFWKAENSTQFLDYSQPHWALRQHNSWPRKWKSFSLFFWFFDVAHLGWMIFYAISVSWHSFMVFLQLVNDLFQNLKGDSIRNVMGNDVEVLQKNKNKNKTKSRPNTWSSYPRLWYISKGSVKISAHPCLLYHNRSS